MLEQRSATMIMKSPNDYQTSVKELVSENVSSYCLSKSMISQENKPDEIDESRCVIQQNQRCQTDIGVRQMNDMAALVEKINELKTENHEIKMMQSEILRTLQEQLRQRDEENMLLRTQVAFNSGLTSFDFHPQLTEEAKGDEKSESWISKKKNGKKSAKKFKRSKKLKAFEGSFDFSNFFDAKNSRAAVLSPTLPSKKARSSSLMPLIDMPSSKIVPSSMMQMHMLRLQIQVKRPPTSMKRSKSVFG